MMEVKTLDSLCLKITDGAHHSPKEFQGGIPMFSVKDMNDHGFDKSSVKTISKEDYKKLKSSGCEPKDNDVLIAKDGSVMKHVFKYKHYEDCALLSSIAILRPNMEIIDPDYLVYSILNPKVKGNIISNYVSGSGVPRIVLKDFKKIEIKVPEIRIQKKVSKFLNQINSKIEVNQKMNETLEEIAKTLFKSWFIDFDPVRAKAEGRPTGLSKEISELFPDSFEDSELGEIPKGWEIKKVKDLGKVICGKTPPTKDKENYGDGFNFVTIPDMHDQVFALESSKTITEKGSKTLKGKLLPTKTICVSCIATPGLTLIIDKPSYTNQQINSIIPNEDLLSCFLFLNFRTLGSKISIYGGGGSVFENMSKSKFEEILIKTPDEKILKYFEDYLCPIFEKIKINSKENKTLTRIRDTLLPKLISGELKIPDQGNLEEAGV